MESPNYPRQFPVSTIIYIVFICFESFDENSSDWCGVQVESVAWPHQESAAYITQVTPDTDNPVTSPLQTVSAPGLLRLSDGVSV